MLAEILLHSMASSKFFCHNNQAPECTLSSLDFIPWLYKAGFGIERDVEIDSEVADGEHSVILDQVSSGISVRMAIMSIIIDNRKNEK